MNLFDRAIFLPAFELDSTTTLTKIQANKLFRLIRILFVHVPPEKIENTEKYTNARPTFRLNPKTKKQVTNGGQVLKGLNQLRQGGRWVNQVGQSGSTGDGQMKMSGQQLLTGGVRNCPEFFQRRPRSQNFATINISSKSRPFFSLPPLTLMMLLYNWTM